jgi:hypothetical protein
MVTKTKLDDPHAAGIYRAIALRFYSRYVEARDSAKFRGGDLPDHGRRPTQSEADERYNAAVEDCIVEAPHSADAALALVEFAGILAADRLIGEMLLNPVDDERDAYHQARALANVAGWVNKLALEEFVEQERAKLGKGDAA